MYKFTTILALMLASPDSHAGVSTVPFSRGGVVCLDARATAVMGADGLEGVEGLALENFREHPGGAASGDTVANHLPSILSYRFSKLETLRECPWGGLSITVPQIKGAPIGEICLMPSPTVPGGKSSSQYGEEFTSALEELRNTAGIDSPLWFRGCIRLDVVGSGRCPHGEYLVGVKQWVTPETSSMHYEKTQFRGQLVEQCVPGAP